MYASVRLSRCDDCKFKSRSEKKERKRRGRERRADNDDANSGGLGLGGMRLGKCISRNSEKKEL